MRANDLFDGVTPRGKMLFTAGLAALLLAPEVADSYLISILTLIFWFAYVGQAWNVMMGFAGQLSLGHALYVGLGGYGAAALYLHLGLGPWVGMLVVVPVCALVGMAIGWLGFRFGVRGVHFALLTIACAEFTRVAHPPGGPEAPGRARHAPRADAGAPAGGRAPGAGRAL